MAGMEAFVELRGRLLDTDKKMKQVAIQEASLAQERRRAVLTLQELTALPDGTRAYQGVGKAFVLEPMGSVRKEQEDLIKKCDEAQESLQSTKKYLEKQMNEVQHNFKELMQQVPGLAQQLMQMSPPSGP